MTVSRAKAAARIVELLDSPVLRALAEPARLEVLRVLLLHGPADIGALASHLPQDRSVVSRHLKTLEDAGLVRAEKDGRHRRYELDGGAFIAALERILGETRAMAAVCCPPAPAPLVPAHDLVRRR